MPNSAKGIGKERTVKINEISCVFEFAVYKYNPNQHTSACSQVTGETIGEGEAEVSGDACRLIFEEVEPEVLPSCGIHKKRLN